MAVSILETHLFTAVSNAGNIARSIDINDNGKCVILVVTVYDTSATDGVVSSTQWGGTGSFTKVDEYYDATCDGHVSIWFKNNPFTGSVSCNVNFGGTVTDAMAVVIVVDTELEVDATATPATGNGSPTITWSTTDPDTVCVSAALSDQSVGTNITCNDTSLYVEDMGSDTGLAGYAVRTSSGSQTIDWTDTDNDEDWVAVGASFTKKKNVNSSVSAYMTGPITVTDNQEALMIGISTPTTDTVEVDFEEGDLSDFDSTTGTLTVSTSYKMAGKYGASFSLDTGTYIPAYGTISDVTGLDSGFLWISFWVHPQNFITTGFDSIFLLSIYSSGGTKLVRMRINDWSSSPSANYMGYDVGIKVDTQPDTALISFWASAYSIPANEPVHLGLLIVRESYDGAADGWIAGYVNGDNNPTNNTYNLENYNAYNDFDNLVFGLHEEKTSSLQAQKDIWIDDLFIATGEGRPLPYNYDNIPAYIKGGVAVSDNIPAYIEGESTGTGISDNQAAYIKGQDTASDNIPAYMRGSIDTSDNQEAYLRGSINTSDNESAYLRGSIDTTDNQEAYLKGEDTSLDNQTAYLVGSLNITDNQIAYTQGQDTATDSQSVYLSGGLVVTDNQIAYLQGNTSVVDNQSAYLKGSQDTTNNQTAYLVGLIDITDNQVAYLKGQDTTSDFASAYLKGQDTQSDSQIAYLAGGIVTTDNQIAYLEGGAIFASDAQNAYLQGVDTAQDSQSAYLIGSIDTSDQQIVYTKGQNTLQDNIPAYLAGHDFSTDNQAGYLKGQDIAVDNQIAYLDADAIATSNLEAFTHGLDTDLDNIPAYLVGGITATDNQAAYLEATGILATDQQAAYLAGIDTTSDNQPAYLLGSIDTSDSNWAYTKGKDNANDNQEAYVQGSIDSSAQVPAYLLGSQDTSANLAGYVAGQSSTSDNILAYIHGQDTQTDSSSAYVHGQESLTDNIPAFTAGGINVNSDVPVFTIGQDNTTGSLSAYLLGYEIPWHDVCTVVVNTGSIVSGTRDDTWSNDDNELVLGEVASTPGYSYDFYFGCHNDVPTTSLQLFIHGNYDGNPAHNVKLQQYNFNLTQWDNVTANSNDFPQAGSEQIYWFSLLDDANYLDNGEIRLRIIHTSTGNPVHQLHIDWMHLDYLGLDTVSAYLSGQDNAIDNQSAYLVGQDTSQSNQIVFLVGQSSSTDNQFAFLSGKDTASTSQSAYLVGSSSALTDQAAYLIGSINVTDNLGAYLEGDVYEELVPDADITTGSWKNELDGSVLWSSIDEWPADDDDYVYYDGATGSESFEVRLSDPEGDPDVGGIHTIIWRSGKIEGSSTITMKVELIQNTTVIASDQQVITDSFQTFEYNLTQGEIDNITDYTDLRLRFTVVGVV